MISSVRVQNYYKVNVHLVCIQIHRNAFTVLFTFTRYSYVYLDGVKPSVVTGGTVTTRGGITIVYVLAVLG